MKSDENVDVGVVTIRGLTEEFLAKLKVAVPINNLLVDKTKPLGKARENIIKQVTTEKFVFVDDDVYLPPNWYNALMQHWKDELGWIEGWAIPTNPSWYNRWTLSRFKEAKDEWITRRGFTLDTVIQTDLVRDWRSPENLHFYEDQALTKHVLSKGKRILRVPLASEHRISYDIFEQTRKGIPQSNMTEKQKMLWAGATILSGVKTMDAEIAFNATKLALVGLTTRSRRRNEDR